MSSPDQGNDTAENALKNAEIEQPNACKTEKELLLADTNIISQVETNESSRELNSSISQEDMCPQATENSQSEAEKTQNDPPNEELTEDVPLLQIPIPRKLIFPRLRLFSIIYLSIPQPQIHENKPLSDKTMFYPGRMEMKISDYFPNSTCDKIVHSHSLQQRVPLIHFDEINRMIIYLLCRRNFSPPERCLHNTWLNHKYVAILSDPNILNNIERNIVFGRPLRVYYYHPLIERLTQRKTSKSYQNNNGNHPPVRPRFYLPQFPTQNIVHRKYFKSIWRPSHKLKLVIITYKNNWKYLCPICGCTFDNFQDFKHHFCNFSGN
ncbi:CPX chromosomal region candidate gene 1 protein [Peromyscus californicus insignis]|uniref:CPX chromosomal region candidate gene 1 protein n=1 Tax=Peromyscus californicus insignis TaxID=564181 RepID=UPI0022A6ACB3|nr:CPX chromosomal region candidate gene 1 protein [Peromyscus californicus insignis]